MATVGLVAWAGEWLDAEYENDFWNDGAVFDDAGGGRVRGGAAGLVGWEWWTGG